MGFAVQHSGFIHLGDGENVLFGSFLQGLTTTLYALNFGGTIFLDPKFNGDHSFFVVLEGVFRVPESGRDMFDQVLGKSGIDRLYVFGRAARPDWWNLSHGNGITGNPSGFLSH